MAKKGVGCAYCRDSLSRENLLSKVIVLRCVVFVYENIEW